MAFPFPQNPTDGQVVTQAQADGSTLVATYKQLKNEWVVQRVLPKDPNITLQSGTSYTVTPGADGQVLTFDAALNQWVGKTPAAASGSKGQTYSKGTQVAPDTPNPPDPALPKELLRQGALQTTLENLHHELKAWDGTAWVNVFTEEEIKAWISAGSLFRGVVKEAGLNTLPAVALANRGFYWSWTGQPGYVVKAGDAPIGSDLTGEVLQVGDWIQSDGSKWVHVPGDLLSKQRWNSLGSFAPWSDTSWESGSVISYQKAFFRASALVSPGDAAPGDGSPGNKWVDITPLPHMSTGDLNNVNANTINPVDHGLVFQWDANIGEWVASDILQVSEVQANTIFVGDDQKEITDVADVNLTSVLPAYESTTVPSVSAVKDYIAAQPKPFLEELEDCGDLSFAAAGEVPSWDAANSKWVPLTITTALSSLTDVDLGTVAQTDGQYLKWDATASKWVPTTITTALSDLTDVDLTTAAPTDGQQLKWDATGKKWIPTTINLGDLGDTTLSTPAKGNLLQFDDTTSKWVNWVPDYLSPTNGYTKTEVDNKITAVVTGLEHFESVLSRADTPPASPATNDLYIVGVTPTGVWAGKNNQLARWSGTAWTFEVPKDNESHLVEDVAETWHWNGTDWVKVATATTTGGPAAAGDLWMVGAIQQSMLNEAQFKALLSVTEQAKWVLADGRNVSGTKYATATGQSTVPDLRGAFLRMAGNNASNNSWGGGSLNTFYEDTTRRPRNTNLVGTAESAGRHYHYSGVPIWGDEACFYGYHDGLTPSKKLANYDGTSGRVAQTDNDGAHTHNVTIMGGGDTETAPKHYSVNYFIKVN